MAERTNLLAAAWSKARWWWVAVGWAWFIVGLSAMVATRARALEAHAGLPSALWSVWGWFVIVSALLLVCAGTLRLASYVLKWPWAAALLSMIVVTGQIWAGLWVAFMLLVRVHLWAGGSL